MRSFWSEPFLWIHLSGIAVVPFALIIVWLGLAVGNPFTPFWLELIFLVFVGIIPIFWMQWHRPFDIFSLLIIALKPDKLTSEQLRLLSLFKTQKQKVFTIITALAMVVVLWAIYQVAPLAGMTAALLPQWRILGLLIAAFAFFLSNLFLQVPISVLGVLFTSEQKWAVTETFSPEKISQSFTVPGFRLNKILPIQAPDAP